MNLSTFKIVLVGTAESGKTTFVTRHRTGKFEKEYIPTLGVDVHPLIFHTNRGQICFNMWDCAGQEKYGGLRDGYYIAADGAIVFSTSTDDLFTHQPGLMTPSIPSSMEDWIKNVRHVLHHQPVVLVENKVDIAKMPDKNSEYRALMTRYDMPFYKVSARSNYGFENPFLDLARRLMKDPDLVFIDSPNMKTT